MGNLTSLLTTAVSAYTKNGWIIAGTIVGALGALGLFFFLNYFKKNAPKKNLVGDIKNFFTMKDIFAEELAAIVYYYASIKVLISSFQYISADFWVFLTELIGSLVTYRVVYEFARVIIRIWKNGEKKN